MFHGTFQTGYLSIFYSLGSQPLQLWSSNLGSQSESRVALVEEASIASTVLELRGPVASTSITCPGQVATLQPLTLGITLPYLVLQLMNVPGEHLSLEVALVDDARVRRRFRASTFQAQVRVKPHLTTLPLQLGVATGIAGALSGTVNTHHTQGPGSGFTSSPTVVSGSQWHQLVIDLRDWTKRVYGTSYVETLSVTLHSNCRVRRIYFAEKMGADEDVPAALRLYRPVDS